MKAIPLLPAPLMHHAFGLLKTEFNKKQDTFVTHEFMKLKQYFERQWLSKHISTRLSVFGNHSIVKF